MPAASRDDTIPYDIENRMYVEYEHAVAASTSEFDTSGNANQIGGAHASESSVAPFVVRRQAGDGNCLFRSVSDQVYGTPEHHALLRARCAKYIASERSYFERFISEPFDQFLERIQHHGEWGDDLEIEALSEIFDVRVEIYAEHSQRPMRTFHEACDAQWPHPIRLQYAGNRHYNSLAPTASCLVAKYRHSVPGETEDAAIARSQRRQEIARRHTGSGDVDIALTDHDVLDQSIRLSRLEFKHKSDAEMDEALNASRAEWDHAEQKEVDMEVLDSVLQQSRMEEEQNHLKLALKQSSEGRTVAAGWDAHYPESVYMAMSSGFPLEKCIQGYHLVGDNFEGILAYCCQSLGS